MVNYQSRVCLKVASANELLRLRLRWWMDKKEKFLRSIHCDLT